MLRDATLQILKRGDGIMDFRIEFSCDSGAFDDAEAEIGRILRGISEQVTEHSVLAGLVRDSNGCRIGSWALRGGKDL